MKDSASAVAAFIAMMFVVYLIVAINVFMARHQSINSYNVIAYLPEILTFQKLNPGEY